MDRAIKAEWYDLNDADRDAFLAWCHGEYCPRLQAQPGHIWVGHYNRALSKLGLPGTRQNKFTDDPTVPTGSQYLLLTATATPDVFFDPNAPNAEEAETQRWLNKRVGYRFAIFLEETRVNGPAWYQHLQGLSAPPAMQLGNFITRSEADDLAFSRWYRQRRLPQITRTRGCIGARKLVSIVGWPKHGILYEMTGIEPGEKAFEDRFNAAPPDTEWSGQKVMDVSIHAPHGAHAGLRLWPPL